MIIIPKNLLLAIIIIKVAINYFIKCIYIYYGGSCVCVYIYMWTYKKYIEFNK